MSTEMHSIWKAAEPKPVNVLPGLLSPGEAAVDDGLVQRLQAVQLVGPVLRRVAQMIEQPRVRRLPRPVVCCRTGTPARLFRLCWTGKSARPTFDFAYGTGPTQPGGSRNQRS